MVAEGVLAVLPFTEDAAVGGHWYQPHVWEL